VTQASGFDADDVPVPREHSGTAFCEILERRISRRTLLKGAMLLGAHASLPDFAHASGTPGRPGFTELAHGLDETLHVAHGYTYQVVLRWGDPLFTDSPAFDPFGQSPASQARQFGYNNDFVAWLSLSRAGGSAASGLLVVNHEFVSSEMMHPGAPDAFALTRFQLDTEMLAHGLSVAEVHRQGRDWQVRLASEYNRRITPHTNMRFSGPVSGDRRVRTAYSPDGVQCTGTFANCAGCVTPWGTVLTAEENVQSYFMGQAKKTAEYQSYKRFGLLGTETARSAWGRFHDRWNLDRHPGAALHAGWIVEIDPYDPASVPVKRSALGRCKHEGCDVVINQDGRVVVYMGDDQAFEYIYRFVSRDRYRPGGLAQNLSILDEGELSVAEFTEQGDVVWHPLVWGSGPHTRSNGFASQADVVLDARRAADLAGATPMDRPEEIKVSPQTGHVYAMLTKNTWRTRSLVNPANPRAANRHGHIVELVAPQGDHSARTFRWEIFLLAGNPHDAAEGALYHPGVSEHGWFSNPDNCSFDRRGNLWIASDGFGRQGIADGIWVSATQGPDRALPRHFLRAPKGAEICSPCFTPDHKTMFCSVQHPGEGSDFDRPSTRWPDFDERLPPRPAVVAVMHDQDGEIGN